MKVIAVVFAVLFAVSGYGQITKRYNIYAQTKSGFLIAHRASMTHLVRKSTYGFEVGVVNFKQSTITDSSYHFPQSGFYFNFGNFGYNEVLGRSFSIAHFFGTPIYQSKRGFFIDFRYGTGIGYLTEKYNPETNPTNNAIGSYFNIKVNLKLLFAKHFRYFWIGGGIDFTHFSNGAITRPNLGLNTTCLLLNIGITENKRLAFSKKNLKDKAYLKEKKLLLESIISVSEAGGNPYPAKRYPIVGIRSTFQSEFAPNWAGEASLDFIYNESNFHKFEDSTFTRSDAFQIGIYGGASYRFYQSEITMGIGYYLLDKINVLGKFYNKVGYRYHFNSNWFGVLTVKANVGQADYLEVGIGYKLKSW